jgi:Carboxypeptidase regulatory-like domain/TonB-dependent Receptor Plug Domain/TonB dependent receptor
MKTCHVASRFLLCCLTAAAIAAGSLALAQSVTGVISGTVTDSTKAPVVGANVTITNADTGVISWTGKTNESGVYRAPDLHVGTYNIDVEAPGFKRQHVASIQLTVDQRANIDVAMQIGQVSESVEVEGSTAGQLQTETASIGTTITPSQLQDLPLPSRSPYNLLQLTPGVSSGGDITSQGGVNASQLSINGSRTLNNDILIDGVSVISGSTGGAQTLPPTDSIQEFKVLASSYSAEWGRTSGGIVTMITNSGGNTLHGAAYGYFRNEDMDANNYFNNVIGKARPEDRYNLFGGKLSGPVFIPKVYNGKNRTFYFINYEGLKQASPYSNTSSIPYGAYSQGNFSASPTIIDNPTTKAPFPGNTIPVSLLDPAAVKILALVPGANSTGTVNKTDNILTNNFVSIGSSHPTTNTGLARIDESISEKTRMFVTFNHYNNYSPIQPTFPGSPLESSTGNSIGTGYQAILGMTRTWSPTFVSEFRVAFFRNNSEYTPPSNGINDATTLGIAQQYGIAAPELNISGFSMLGTNSNTLRSQIDNNYQWSLINSKSIRNHLLTFGFQIRRNQFDDFNPNADVNGSYTFNGTITSPKNASGDAINALADFLLGDIATSSYSLPQALIGRRNYNWGMFVQDDWKIRPNLTVNLGVRYEHETPMTASNSEYSRVDPTTGQVLFAGQNGVSDTLNLKSAKFDFGPRLGLAWSFNSKTVLRTGFGIFFDQLFSNLGGQVEFPGYTVEQAFNSQGTGIPQPFKLSQGMPPVATYNVTNPSANIAQFNSAASPLALTGYAGWTQANKLPYAEEWNFGIQREVLKGLILDVNYVGSHGVHLGVNMPSNQPPYNVAIDNQLALTNTTLATQMARPFPSVQAFNSLNYEGVSTYNALQISVKRQFSQNLMFISNYTWSRSIDDSSGIYSFSQPSGLNIGEFPQEFLALNKGLSEFDRTNDFTTAIQYITKGNRWVRGFQVFPMLTVHTGLPLYVGQTNENAAQTGNYQRPNYSGGSLLTTQVPNGTGVQYLLPDTAANFPLTPTGPYYTGSGTARVQELTTSIGNLGRNVLRGPGQLDLNISVGRQFDLRERLKFTIRAEAYNALNHTNFNAPASMLAITANAAGQPIFNSPSYGLITGAGQSRFLQLVARFDF